MRRGRSLSQKEISPEIVGTHSSQTGGMAGVETTVLQPGRAEYSYAPGEQQQQPERDGTTNKQKGASFSRRKERGLVASTRLSAI